MVVLVARNERLSCKKRNVIVREDEEKKQEDEDDDSRCIHQYKLLYTFLANSFLNFHPLANSPLGLLFST